MPTLLELLVDPTASLRSDAAIALGYAATNGADVAGAVPDLAACLSDAEADVRKMAAWALYRIAKYVGSIAAAVPALKALCCRSRRGACATWPPRRCAPKRAARTLDASSTFAQDQANGPRPMRVPFDRPCAT